MRTNVRLVDTKVLIAVSRSAGVHGLENATAAKWCLQVHTYIMQVSKCPHDECRSTHRASGVFGKHLVHQVTNVSNSNTGPVYYKAEEQTAYGAKGCYDSYQQHHRCRPQCCRQPAALGWASQSSWSPHCRSSLAGHLLAPVSSGLLALLSLRACCKRTMLFKCQPADETGEGFYSFVPAVLVR